MQPRILTAHEHCIEHDQIDPDALYVIAKLRQEGHTAYLVGGSVRDLLLHRMPKDFDVSTSAKPEEIKPLFRRSLLIGRRFRLVHVRFGSNKVIEVSTFRAGPSDEGDLIVSDNVWGSPEEDVLRRDFTINGLFFDPTERIVIDYVDGCQDLRSELLRTIGDPDVRFKQDPVRMLRLLKFQARFSFGIEHETEQALLRCHREITKSSPARLLEEILRMLESGAAAPFFHLMTRYGMMHLLFPQITQFLEGLSGPIVYSYLEAADMLLRTRPHYLIDRAALVSCLLYPMLEEDIKHHYLDNAVIPHLGEIEAMIFSLLERAVVGAFSYFPRKIRGDVAFILQCQYRMTPLGSRRPNPGRAVRHPLFQQALRLLKIRSVVHPELDPPYRQWKEWGRQGHSHREGHSHHHHHRPPRQEQPKT